MIFLRLLATSIVLLMTHAVSFRLGIEHRWPEKQNELFVLFATTAAFCVVVLIWEII